MSLSKQIVKLRKNNKLSQESFAEMVGVSRQTVHKWESGVAYPDIANILTISKRFNISADALLLGSDARLVSELSYDKKLQPQYDQIPAWESYSQNIALEYEQSMEEGKDLARYAGLFAEVDKMPYSEEKEKMCDILFNMVQKAPLRADFPYVEPSDWEEIQLHKAGNDPAAFHRPDGRTMRAKTAGAWYGRVAGCLLGKPIEGIRTNELLPLLKDSGNYPMHRYISKNDITPKLIEQCSFRLEGKCYADTIDCAPDDDDTNYVVMGGELVQLHGRDFTPYDVSRVWISSQSKDAYCTAERVAFKNFIAGFIPPESARYQNAFREWIGAQIRGDYFGYINPADPQAAAEMAFRDASISHVKNGIYGELWVAAMLAGAACTDNMEEIIQIGLNEIPTKSRLHEAITKIIAMWRAGATAEEVLADIHSRWNEHIEHHWCHTISNAEIVTACLLFGGGDFGKSICLAVQTGFDTDCNGATVGSIVGMAKGISAIDSKWTEPFHQSLHTRLFGLEKVSLEDMITRTLQHAGYKTSKNA